MTFVEACKTVELHAGYVYVNDCGVIKFIDCYDLNNQRKYNSRIVKQITFKEIEHNGKNTYKPMLILKGEEHE